MSNKEKLQKFIKQKFNFVKLRSKGEDPNKNIFKQNLWNNEKTLSTPESLLDVKKLEKIRKLKTFITQL